MARNDIGAIILAAGQGARFRAAGGEGSKLLAPYHGKALVRHVAEAALAAHLGGVMIVTGADGDHVRAALADLPVSFVENEDYASGMGSSLMWPLSFQHLMVCAAIPFCCRRVLRLKSRSSQAIWGRGRFCVAVMMCVNCLWRAPQRGSILIRQTCLKTSEKSDLPWLA